MAATITAGRVSREIMCSAVLARQEANLLYVLGEYVGRVVPVDDVCHRLKVTRPHLDVICCRLRAKLCGDWIIDHVSCQGPRLSYIGGPLTKVRNHVDIHV